MTFKKTFIDKYPEFKGKTISSITDNGGVKHPITLDCPFRLFEMKDVEKILDKHFIRKKEYWHLFDFITKNIEKESATNITVRINKLDWKKKKKELGLE